MSETERRYDLSRPCDTTDTDDVFVRHGNETDLTAVNCDAVCVGTTPANTLRPVLVTRDVYLNGRRPSRPGIYCVRGDTSVTRCNMATSTLVAGENGRWSCNPKWPAIFGGADGGDILVCGGRLTDGSKAYDFRLPSSDRLGEITDPYAETRRFDCAPGQYVDGPRDHMNNEYVRLSINRFHRIRNNCAKYVANAGSILRPVPGHEGYCNCLATHGRLRRVDSADGSTRGEITESHRDKRDLIDLWPAWDRFRVPYACSPCVASGDLEYTKGVFNFPVGCVKSKQRYFGPRRPMDNMPCGLDSFTTATHPSCVNTWIYVGDGGMSPFVRRATAKT